MGFALCNAREATGASCGLVSEGEGFMPYWLLFPIIFLEAKYWVSRAGGRVQCTSSELLNQGV